MELVKCKSLSSSSFIASWCSLLPQLLCGGLGALPEIKLLSWQVNVADLSHQRRIHYGREPDSPAYQHLTLQWDFVNKSHFAVGCWTLSLMGTTPSQHNGCWAVVGSLNCPSPPVLPSWGWRAAGGWRGFVLPSGLSMLLELGIVLFDLCPFLNWKEELWEGGQAPTGSSCLESSPKDLIHGSTSALQFNLSVKCLH